LVRLPSATKADAAKAEFKDGILTITLPKSEEAKERRIPISGGQQATQTQDVQIEAGADQSGSRRGGEKRSEGQANARQASASVGKSRES